MAKNKSAQTVTVDPATAQTSVPVVTPTAPAQEGAKRKRKRNRIALYKVAGQEKPARGLKETPTDFNAETQRLVQGQFARAHFWFTHCAVMAERRAELYRAKAQDALANPQNYKRGGGATKGALAAQIAALEAVLLAKGFSKADIAAMCAADNADNAEQD